MGELTVPVRFHEALAELAELPEPELAKVIDAFQSASQNASLEHLSGLVEAQHIPGLTSAERTVGALMSVALQREFRRWSVEKISENVANAPTLEIEPEARELLTRALETLLSATPIFTSSKVQDLITEYERVFYHSRVITDMRPIFGEDFESGMAGCLVVHQLKIDFFADGNLRSEFFALDATDLRSLRDDVDRALSKEKQLRTHLEAVDIQVFEIEDPVES